MTVSTLGSVTLTGLLTAAGGAAEVTFSVFAGSVAAASVSVLSPVVLSGAVVASACEADGAEELSVVSVSGLLLQPDRTMHTHTARAHIEISSLFMSFPFVSLFFDKPIITSF